MIGSLRGVVLERTDDSVALIEVAGVGYLVTVTPRTLAELEPGAQAFVHIYHHIREEAQTLYGFLRADERTAFAQLLGAHGVGPALAMAILGTHTPSALIDIVASSDVGALTLVPGVGKKTADRLMVELRGRLSLPVLDPVATGSSAGALADVREALSGLGYGADEIREALRELPTSGDVADLLRDALRQLGVRHA